MKKSIQLKAIATILICSNISYAMGPADLPKSHPGYVSAAQLEASRLKSPLILAEKAWERFYLSESEIYNKVLDVIPGPKPRGRDGYTFDFVAKPRSRTMQQALTDLADVLIEEQKAIAAGLEQFNYKGKSVRTNQLIYSERMRAFKAAKQELNGLMQSMGNEEARLVYRLVSDQVVYQDLKSPLAIEGFDPKKALVPTTQAEKDMIPTLLARTRNLPHLRPTNAVLGLAIAAVGVTSMMGSDEASAAAPSARPSHLVQIPVEQPQEETVQENSDGK